jgi:hypothetical protein
MPVMELGLVQSRGLGDIVIALPIARHFYEQGHRVHWPILEPYLPSFQAAAPWVSWLGVAPGADCYYKAPMALLQGRAEKVFCLYHYLASEPTLADPVLRSVLKFDQYKYAVASVAFHEKWSLARCIARDAERERALFDRLVTQERYALLHRTGINEQRAFDMGPALSKGYQVIEISELSDCVFDWLMLLERASILVLIDSVFSNLVDQLSIGANIPKILLRRSHMDVAWTPVLMGNWKYL